MFYAHFVLSKKGPLARIWLAAHWDKKLTKAHVFETNIEGSVEAIIQPKVKLALRTSGHLLLGVVRIYSRKAKYLLADCNEAFVKIKMAFRPGVVDLPEENREAAVAAITIPQEFHDFDTTMADLTDIDVQAQFTVNQSRPEEITMREDLGNITLVGDDGFGDMGFGTGDNMLQDVHMDDTLFVKNPDQILNDTTKDADKPMDIDLHTRDDGFGDGLGDYVNVLKQRQREGPPGADDDDDDDDGGGDFGGGLDTGLFDNLGAGLFEEQPDIVPPGEDALTIQGPIQEPVIEKPVDGEKDATAANDTTSTHLQEQTTIREQSTLIPNEAEAFALEPIDVTNLPGTERRTKRKRKLIIDEQKGIPSETMKMQLSDTSEIIATLDLAPPTKKLMHWKETGGVEKLFALPGRALVSKQIEQFFNRNLITKSIEYNELDQLGIELGRDETRQDQSRGADESHVSTAEVARDAENTTISGERFEEAPSMLQVSMPQAEQGSMMSNHDPTLDSTLIHRQEDDFSALMGSARRMSSDDDNDLPGGFDDDSLSPPPHEEPLIEGVNEDLQALPEEDAQLAPGETEEEYEERRWKGRTQQMMHIVSRGLQKNDEVSFFNMIAQNNRKQVASKFYTLLVLKKIQAIEVKQDQPFGDILLTAGPKAATVC